MQCPNCGDSVAEGSSFCPSCGAKFQSDAQAAKKKPGVLKYVVVAVVVVVVAVYLLGGHGHTLQSDLPQSKVAELADNYKGRFGIIPCSVDAEVSGNTITLRAKLPANLDDIAGDGAASIWQALGLDKYLANYVITDDMAAKYAERCRDAESDGYANAKFVLEVYDDSGGRLISRTVTKAG